MELELSERTPCAIRIIFPSKGVVRMIGGRGHCLHVCEVVAAGKVNAEQAPSASFAPEKVKFWHEIKVGRSTFCCAEDVGRDG